MLTEPSKTYIRRVEAFLDDKITIDDMVQLCQTVLELNQLPILPPAFHVAVLHCAHNGLVHFNGRALH